MPENIKTAWKVAREENGAWKSAIVNGKACVSYAIGERSRGFVGTPVMVFLSAQKAREWQREYWPDRVLLGGQAGGCRRQWKLADLAWPRDGHFLRVFRRFWQYGDATGSQSMDAPSGTHAADWFEPEMEVSR